MEVSVNKVDMKTKVASDWKILTLSIDAYLVNDYLNYWMKECGKNYYQIISSVQDFLSSQY
jgi:hypothetical protein